MVEASGYVYNVPPDVVPNSHKALQVTELARDVGVHEAVHDRLMHAYWSEAANIGDEDTLLGLAREPQPADQAQALVDGFHVAYLGSALMIAAGFFALLFLLRREDVVAVGEGESAMSPAA